MNYSDHELEAFLDEALPAEEMGRVEEALRSDSRLLARLAALQTRRDGGAHTVGEIWRRHRLSCPSREQLGAYLLDALPAELRDYIGFHIQVVGCRLCEANLTDLKAQEGEPEPASSRRRKKYFQSSAGYLRR